MLCVTFHAFRFCVIQAYLIDAKHVAHKHTKAVCCGSSTFCTSGPSSDIAYLHTFCVYHVRYTSAVSGVYLQIQQNYLVHCLYVSIGRPSMMSFIICIIYMTLSVLTFDLCKFCDFFWWHVSKMNSSWASLPFNIFHR